MTSETLAPAPAASTRSAPHPTGRRRRTFAGVKYVLQSFAILLVVMIIPLLAPLYYRFTAFPLLGSPTWPRAHNHLPLFQDPSFIDPLVLPAIYPPGPIPLPTILSLVIAEAVVRRFRNLFGRIV